MPQAVSDALSVQALQRWVREFAQLVEENTDHLTQLDAAIGDADHGTNMDRGLSAVTAALAGLAGTTPPTAGALFKEVGMTLVRTVGGASGPLFGTFFLRVGTSLAERNEVLPADFAAALRAGLDGVVARGKADPGDKTMYDALAPAIDALDAALAAGEPLADALRRAHAAAEEGRDKTIPMLARKGRASYLGERSVGHQDPGATTVALLLRAAADAAAAPSG